MINNQKNSKLHFCIFTNYIEFDLKKKEIENLNFYELTPCRNYEYEITDLGLVNVLVPKFTDKVFGKILQPRLKHKYIRANLDKIGSASWLLIDGKNKVFEIIDKLKSDSEEEIKQIDDRLIMFLSNLFKNGFINFIELKN